MTTTVFQCSTCGAPLLPRQGATVLRCPYCQTSVAAPESLRLGSTIQAWSILVFDPFLANDHDWLVGNQDGERFAPLKRSISDGRYRWEARVRIPASIAPAWLHGYPVSDFHLRVTCKHLRGSRPGSSYGVIFRVQDNENCYCFRIIDTQFYAISRSDANHWQQLVDWQRADSIKPYGANQIEVIAQGSHFTFLVNGAVVHELDDQQFARGLVGLAIEGYTPDEDIAFDFLDITLRVP